MRLLRDAARAARLLRRQGPLAFGRMVVHQGRRALARRSPRYPFLAADQPAGDLLGMTTSEEQAYLFWYASREYTGAGEIVDLGCWFGSSTIPLAAGLAANPAVSDRRRRIHAFDLFLWETWMEETLAGTALAGKLREGESFQPQFEERVAAYRDAIDVRPGDLTRLRWDPARPIELAFNDASKSWALANNLLRHFYPSLVPGVARLVEQDFAHFFTPWVHLIHWRLRDAFEPVVHVPYSGSMVFRPLRRIEHPLAARDFDFADFSEAEIDAAFDRSLALVDPPMRPNVWASRVMLEIHRDRRDRAAELLAAGARRGLRGLDIDKVGAHL